MNKTASTTLKTIKSADDDGYDKGDDSAMIISNQNKTESCGVANTKFSQRSLSTLSMKCIFNLFDIVKLHYTLNLLADRISSYLCIGSRMHRMACDNVRLCVGSSDHRLCRHRRCQRLTVRHLQRVALNSRRCCFVRISHLICHRRSLRRCQN